MKQMLNHSIIFIAGGLALMPTVTKAFQESPAFFEKIDPKVAKVETVSTNALEWIADHQLPDGSWNFDHSIGPGDHRDSPNPGTAREAKNAATAMALLPFLGAGQTHLKGKYKDVVQSGIKFLISNQEQTEHGGSFYERGGTMYSHGLASMALCEAYGISGDMKLLKPAQDAIDFIVYAQDPFGGGWRYQPRQPGDTSVFGWQIAALISGQLAGLDVPGETIERATKYLDACGMEGGSYYGYVGPTKSATNTCIGLLCRMEIGWNQDKALKKGIEYISKNGPLLKDKTNMYHNYFASQALYSHHVLSKDDDKDAWNQFQSKLRDFLMAEQSKAGPTKGSWFFNHGYSRGGGRLYDTALATLTLEIYYRHLIRWQHAGKGFDFED